MNLFEKIGQNIRQRREDAGLTQEELAQKVGLTRTSVTNFEKGIQKIQVDTLYAIAEALNVSTGALLPYGGAGKKLQVEDRFLKGLPQGVKTWLKEGLVLREGKRITAQVYERGEEPDIEQILKDFELKEAPVPIEDVAFFLGVEVLYAAAKQKLAGCLYQDKEISVIAINSSQSRNRQRFTIAHLLAWKLLNPKEKFHLDLGFSDLNEKEAEANQSALQLLIPDFLVERDLKDSALDFEDDNEYRRLAEKYKVSPLLISKRLAEKG